jgi:hypothetical protein
VNRLLLGVLAYNPISFTGERGRANVNATYLQPIIVKSLPHEWFIREDPILVLDWREHGTAVVPVNLGVGRVLKIARGRLMRTCRRNGQSGGRPIRTMIRRGSR